MNRVFIDSDVLLDVILNRKDHCADSQKILALAESNKIAGCTSALVIANCYYIVESNRDKATADRAVRKLRSILNVLPLTDKEIGESLSSSFKDFEDGVQFFIAMNNAVDTIITRNISDYKKASVKVLSPKDYLSLEDVLKLLGKGEASGGACEK